MKKMLAVSSEEFDDDRGYVKIFQLKKKNKNKWIQLGQKIEREYPGDDSGWGLSLSKDGKTVATHWSPPRE